MTQTSIPKEVSDFIVQSVHSIEQLEILLFLADRPDKACALSEILGRIQSNENSIREKLQVLMDLGLVEVKESRCYQFHPSTEKLADVVRGLQTAYRERRVRVIELIYQKGVDQIQSFADAFRIKKKDKDG